MGDIALDLGIVHKTVRRILRRYRNTNNFTPDKTTARGDRSLLTMAQRHRSRSARALDKTANRP